MSSPHPKTVRFSSSPGLSRAYSQKCLNPASAQWLLQCWSTWNSVPLPLAHSSALPTAHLQPALPRSSFHRKHLLQAPHPSPAPQPPPQPASHPSTPNPPRASPVAQRALAASAPGPSAPSLPCSPSPLLAPTGSNHFPLWYRPRSLNRKRSGLPSCSIQMPTHFSPTCAWLLSYPIFGQRIWSRNGTYPVPLNVK